MAVSGFWSVVLLLLQAVMFLSVIITLILVVKLRTIKLKTRAAYVGVAINVAAIVFYFLLRYLVL